MNYPQLSPSEFTTFVLIYAAHADYDYSDPEIKIIKNLCSEADYNKMLELFNKTSDYNVLRIVLENKKSFCNTDQAKSNLYQLITKVFEADGDYSRPEKVFLNFLDRMITQ